MKLETFFENFELLTDAPNAAANLRGLILQLAVRGKLVPQDANDEPAYILLEKIQEEKNRLIKQKLIKNNKVTTSEKNDNPSYILPNGWIWVQFQDITSLITCGIASTPKYTDNGKPFLSAKNVKPYKFMPDEYKFVSEADYLKITQSGKPEKNDILLTRVGAGIGEAAIIDQEIEFAYYVSLTLIKPIHKYLSSKFLLHWLNSPEGINKTLQNTFGQGVSQGNLNVNQVRQFTIPLPPLAEQKRIVEKCDRLLSICDEIEKRQQQRQESIVRMNESAIAQLLSSQNPDDFRQHWQRICNNFDLLYSVPETIPKLRQAILQLAVQGKLVRQSPNEEPASKVLQKIKKEKEELERRGIVVKEKQLTPISLDELSFNIPESWIWVRLGQIVNSIRYGTSKHCSYEQNGVPILRIPNIIDGKIDQQDLKFTLLPEKERLELQLEKNDLLMIRSNGSKSLVGKTAIVSKDVEGYGYAGYLVRLKFFLNYINPRYINLALDTNFVRYQIEFPIRTTSGVKNINSTEISNLILPLPPLAEQKRIVEKCDRLMSLCDTLEAKLKQGRESSEKLMEIAARQVLAN